MIKKISTSSLATLIGLIAILLWGVLALFSKQSENFPPFQLLAMCFSIAFLFMLIKWIIFKQSIILLLKQPVMAWIISCSGLFLYHASYFFALANAPVLEVSLIAYLWPLLIVLFSAFLPGEKLHFKHCLGALVSLIGCWILLGGFDSQFNQEYYIGYGFAAACAVIWSLHSLALKLVHKVPTDAVGLFCGVSAILGWACHLTLEETYLTANTSQWLAVIGLGLGPLGLAFFAWDYAIKKGNIQLLGVFSYLTPLISTLVLIIFSDAVATTTVYIACIAIVLGALIASLQWKTLLLRK